MTGRGKTDAAFGVAGSAPRAPHDVTVVADYTSVTLSWRQDGLAEAWTVYYDPMDGSDVESFPVSEPRCIIRDLPPGPHEFSVIAWHDGEPSDYDGCLVAATVPQQPPGQPTIPVITSILRRANTIEVEWISQDATLWQARLLDADGAVCRRPAVASKRQILFIGVEGCVTYGVQVRAIAGHVTSPWCDPTWTIRLEPVASRR